ncbi:MAG: hypothetical protein EA380_10255 [Phycisphaeraceae bacterium]|nr:MAG: hypothetical protein EA380_10255 [Phycisphaeraceae bacterium]
MTHNTPRNMLRKTMLVSTVAGLFLLGGCGDSKSEQDEAAPRTTPTATTPTPGTTNATTPAREQSEAERTLRRFVQHLAEIEFEEALELCDPSSAGYTEIESQLSIITQNPPSASMFRPLFSGAYRDAQVEPVRVEDSRARFQLTSRGNAKTIDMQRIDGNWLVLAPEGLVDMAIRSFSPTDTPPRN